MYQSFLQSFKSEISEAPIDANSSKSVSNSLIENLFTECGGRNFSNGAYKIHTRGSSLHWTSMVCDFFPEYNGRIIPFGFDWMGRQFCADKHNENNIFMLDPATAEAFELSINVEVFHNRELVDDSDSYLDEAKFKQAVEKLHVARLEYSECIGYKIPLFLNGKDDLDNLEVADNEIYWEFQSQIHRQIKNLPPGTKIDSVTIE